MDQSQLKALLTSLIANWEDEVVEFKAVGDSFKTSDIGKYLSALANEANLRNLDRAWLVFGVNNKTREIEDSRYRADRERLDSLKQQMAQGTDPLISFKEIHELADENGRVVLFEIPPAPRGAPIAWNGHFYGRDGESLGALSLAKQDEIRDQPLGLDWSAIHVDGAELKDLDEQAILRAREGFARKHANRISVDEVMEWSVETFLDRAKVAQNGKITRTAILLLGKPESSHLLSPHPAQITWKLVGQEQAYEHFGPPFLLTTSEVYRRIRNIQLRILPADSLLANEVAKYDQKIILEAMHNCIAHQDYRRNGRVLVTEFVEQLVFENEGGFFEGAPDDYVLGERTPRRYRNPFLTQAMAALNMIDTMGFGIHSMYQGQKNRYFPLPDYDLSEPDAVKLTIYGEIIDLAYSRALIVNTDIPLEDVFALDRIQKHLPVDTDTARRLRKQGLIEGRKPNYYVSSKIAVVTGQEATYIRTRSQDDTHYNQLILDYLREFESASRDKIDELLTDKLSDGLSAVQKRNKISRLLTDLRKANSIENIGSRKSPCWQLTPSVRVDSEVKPEPRDQ
jgi:ATP-dependent DNA helicase RecG